MRHVTILTSGVIALSLLVGALADAQTQPPLRQHPQGPPAPPAAHEVQGTIQRVDPGARSVQISSGLFGIFGSTLMVTGDTWIEVAGKQAKLIELRPGDKVQASYEVHNGRNIATTIVAMPEARPPAEGQEVPSRRGTE